jgi:hypothetical protein
MILLSEIGFDCDAILESLERTRRFEEIQLFATGTSS